jgi:hypothetical protein
MCDPIIDGSMFVEKEPFGKEVVETYLLEKSSFSKYPLRHYNQLELPFDIEEVKEVLKKHNIPIENTHVTVFAGYTGQFAACLRQIGMKVTFTDPLKEWVEKASQSKFEAHQYAAEEIPKEILMRTELFATFEGYMPFISERGIYNTLRFLTAEYGILFAESMGTRKELDKEIGEEVKGAQLKNSFLPYAKVYSIKRAFREKGQLRLYHFCGDKEARETIKFDCRVMKTLYDNFDSDAEVDGNAIKTVAEKMGVTEKDFLLAVRRVLNLYQYHIPRALKIYFPDNFFDVASKRFRLAEDVLTT